MKYTKICKHCGETFETNSPQKIYCNRQHFRPCPVCGKAVAMIDNDFSRSPKCCSPECSHVLRASKFKMKKCVFCGKIFQPKSGVQIACDNIHYSKCEICGKDFIRTIANYNDGVTTCSQECTAEKVKKTNLKKYGTEHPMQNKEVQEHFHSAMRKKYGVDHALQIPKFVAKQQNSAYKTNMEHSGVPYACLTPNCINAQKHIISAINKKFAAKLKELNIRYELEYVIDKKSFDIYLPDSKTLIEIDPTYTHNSYSNHFGNPIDRYYHRDKTQLALNEGMRCIHVFDWDYWTHIFNLITPISTRIYARKCTIYRLNKNIGDDFLNKYHIQGSCRGQRLYLGLVHDDELVQVMTFGKSRFNSSYHGELLRLCTRPEYQIIGGASRLFSYAVSEYGLESIISYCDLSKFTGDVYEKIGMKFSHKSPPQEIWSKGSKKITANLLRSRGYDQLFKTTYGKDASNEDLMLKNGWLPVYDCGQLVYVTEN